MLDGLLSGARRVIDPMTHGLPIHPDGTRTPRRKKPGQRAWCSSASWANARLAFLHTSGRGSKPSAPTKQRGSISLSATVVVSFFRGSSPGL